MLIRLPYETYKKFDSYSSNGQSALLQEVKQVIEKTYSVTSLKADGQIISVPFSDGINFEILPAFLNKDGSYTFANTHDGGSWKTTDPKAEIQAINDRNNSCNHNLKQLCKMARAWKNKNDVDISGILIDILAYNFIGSWEYRDKSYMYYDWMTRDFMKYVSEVPSSQYKWQAMGSGRYISDRSKEKPRKHITKHWKQLLKRQIIRQRQTTSGGRFMEANSRTYSEALYSQIEDAYGKLLYSYTTQIVEAGRVAKKNRRLKWTQFILSALSTGGFIGTIISNQQVLIWVGGLCSTALLVLTAYFKDVDFSALQKSHLSTSNKLWLVREKYISLLTDFEALDEASIKLKRDELQTETSSIYDEAPITSEKSYSIAQDLLKNKEAQFFSRDELNKMLPQHLRKKK